MTKSLHFPSRGTGSNRARALTPGQFNLLTGRCLKTTCNILYIFLSGFKLDLYNAKRAEKYVMVLCVMIKKMPDCISVNYVNEVEMTNALMIASLFEDEFTLNFAGDCDGAPVESTHHHHQVPHRQRRWRLPCPSKQSTQSRFCPQSQLLLPVRTCTHPIFSRATTTHTSTHRTTLGVLRIVGFVLPRTLPATICDTTGSMWHVASHASSHVPHDAAHVFPSVYSIPATPVDHNYCT